jgi:DNA-binding transcriptional LysR family regulator
MLDVQRLRVFRAVVASGSVQAAADHLGYTPSAISQHLTALQRETGLVLFEKAGRGIAPTPTAKVLAAESDELMGSLTRLGGVVDHLREGRSGSVTIGTFDSAAQSWLPYVAQGLQRDYPDVVLELSLDELGTAGQASPTRRDIEVANESADDPGSERPGYSRLVLCEEGYCVAVPTGHELLERYDGPVPMSALAEAPMIDNDFHHTGCSRIISNACHTALAFVAGGIGVTILPDLAVPEEMPGVESRPLVNPTPRRRIVAHVRDGAAMAPPVAHAVGLLQEAAAQTAARRSAT